MSPTNHVPYFYIIEHTPSGMRYAGSKWGRDANPSTFMIEGGYTTSSKIVNQLIEQDGLGSFKTHLIITDFGFDMTSHEYETVFLQSNDIANDDKWFNNHNNNNGRFSVAPGTDDFKQIMLKMYGVENPFQNESIKQKSKETNLRKLGVEHSMQSEYVKAKSKNTLLKNYGVENPSQSIIIEDRKVLTNMKNCGYTHSSKTPERRKLVGELTKGTTVWNDGEKEYRLRKGDIPESHWVNAGIPRRKKTPEENKKQSEQRKGMKLWNDGIRNHRVYAGQLPELHWKLGKIVKNPR